LARALTPRRPRAGRRAGDETQRIGQGTHTQAPIDLARFERRMAGR